MSFFSGERCQQTNQTCIKYETCSLPTKSWSCIFFKHVLSRLTHRQQRQKMIFVNSERKSRKNTGSKKDPHPTLWMMIFDGEVWDPFKPMVLYSFIFTWCPEANFF